MSKYQQVTPVIDPHDQLENLSNTIFDSSPEDLEKEIDLIADKSLFKNTEDNLGAILTQLCAKGQEDSKYIKICKKFISKIDVQSLSAASHQEFLHGMISNRNKGGEDCLVIPLILEMVKNGFDPGVLGKKGENALEIAVQQSQTVNNSNTTFIDQSLISRLIADAKIAQIFLRSGKIPDFENEKGFAAGQKIEEFLQTKNHTNLRRYLGENFHHREYFTTKEIPDCKTVDESVLNGLETPEPAPSKTPGTEPNNISSSVSLMARLCHWMRLR